MSRGRLVKLGHVALDGSKIKANASKHKAMSYGCMTRAEVELQAAVAGWLAEAEAADAADDAAHGPEQRGKPVLGPAQPDPWELPEWVEDKQARLAKIKEAKAALEAEAQAEPPPADAEPGPSAEWTAAGRGAPRAVARRSGRSATSPIPTVGCSRPGMASSRATTASSRSTGHIIAQRLTTNGSDQDGLVPLLDAAKAALGRKPREVSADAGFCRETNLATLEERRIRGYLAPGRADHGAPDPSGRRRIKPGSLMAKMAAKLKRAGRRSRYRLRKQTVEPMFGQIKQARGFRRFLLRGSAKVKDEWALVCTAHNLTKLLAARTA